MVLVNISQYFIAGIEGKQKVGDFGCVQKEKAGRGRKGGWAQEYFENSGMDLRNIYLMCQLEVWYFIFFFIFNLDCFLNVES